MVDTWVNICCFFGINRPVGGTNNVKAPCRDLEHASQSGVTEKANFSPDDKKILERGRPFRYSAPIHGAMLLLSRVSQPNCPARP